MFLVECKRKLKNIESKFLLPFYENYFVIIFLAILKLWLSLEKNSGFCSDSYTTLYSNSKNSNKL